MSTICLNRGLHFGIYSTSLQHLRIDIIPALFLRAAAECVSSCYGTVHLFKWPCCGLRAVPEQNLLFGQSPAYKVWREGVPLRSGASPPVRPVPVNTTPQWFPAPRMTVRMFCYSMFFFFRGSINSIIILTLTFVTKCDSYIQGAVLLTAAGRYIIFCILHADAVLSCQDIFTGIFELDFMTWKTTLRKAYSVIKISEFGFGIWCSILTVFGPHRTTSLLLYLYSAMIVFTACFSLWCKKKFKNHIFEVNMFINECT